MYMTGAKAREASLQLAATLLSQAAGDRGGDVFQRLRRAGASERELEVLRLEMVAVVDELRAQARRADPPNVDAAGMEA